MMFFKSQNFLHLLKSYYYSIEIASSSSTLFNHQQWRTITKVRLKWVKNKSIDHIIDKETDLKAAMLLKDAIKRSPTSFITAKTIADWQKLLGLTVPVLRFLRRYPTLFHEFPHSRYPSLPCFKLTELALTLDQQEHSIYENDENSIIERLCKVLMMTKSKSVPLQSLYCLKWDLGLPDFFEKTFVSKYPDHFRVSKGCNGLPFLSLVQLRDEYAVSALQKSGENSELGIDYWQFKKGQTALAFPMKFPKGYGYQKKVRAWMEEFQKLPYISPYEDSSRLDPKSELMEKRNVGVLHEFLSLTIHKKTKRNYMRSLREELNLPHRFTRIFTRYPGIFYLSLKCKTTTVTLKEGYQSGKLVNPHPLARVRDKFYYVMRTGLLYRGKGVKVLSPQDCLIDDVIEDGNGDEVGDNMDEEEHEMEEYWEEETESSDEDPEK
ncbi:protein WHAT'S THIS FACTOR 9, mitochondrial [Amaranthus tricolor]|uniref:protein WHAT'S THIS FACTOR 9, mitochondrial n=1 Tax=Amaranthus tricolor TaxID=29722 RepID=UPI0025883874|nr:protein WHAT'S THIS FACTOR 9, mitochondrial [Amaranthus tricolor]XP_057535024.1 protein WHAT'S THIS FACTOR 9, mitochondrial [Amaranthus tricolor]